MTDMLAPLAMSQTKDDLLKRLNLPPETYALMAKETDGVYKWLTADKTHLKKNCKRKPPYDWSDIQEKAKDDAMGHIARIGNEYTSYYWNLATPTPDCPNWIARWFLYHKFRYRDGRNRNPDKEEDGKHHNRSSKHRTEGDHHDQAGYYNQGSSSGQQYQTHYKQESTTTPTGYTVAYPTYDSNTYHPTATSSTASTTRYDPVRDVVN